MQEDTLNKYWWLTEDEIEQPRESGLVSARAWAKYKSYAKQKALVWRWFRKQIGRKDLTPACKLVLWACCERHRHFSCSVNDKFTYLALMTGLDRRSVSNAIHALASEEKNIIWIASEGERLLMRKAKRGYKKHLLLVGLESELRASERGLGENTFFGE